MPRTLGTVLRNRGGHAPGLAQAMLFLIATWIVFQGLRIGEGFVGGYAATLWIVPYAVVPALAALFGFSLARDGHRIGPHAAVVAIARRAIPNYTVAVLGAALVLGPLFTTDGLRQYFLDPSFGFYFLNLIGWPQFALPGVFEFNEYPVVVNEALWLIPCVAITVILWALSLGSWRFARWTPLLAIAAILVAYTTGEAIGVISSPAASSLRGGYVAGALGSVIAGQVGTLAYRWRERTVVGWPIVAVTLGALGAIAVAAGPGFVDLPGTVFVIAMLATCAALAVSATELPGGSIIRHAAPLTYGAMLFSFPLLQATAAAGIGRGSALVGLAVGLPLALVASFALDWLLVRTGLAPAYEPSLPDDLTTAGPDDRPKRSWKKTVRRSSGGLIVALAVATIALLVIAITLVALQKDPVGV